jgi:hypothetical protein
MTDTLIRYSYNDFDKFKELNNVMPKELYDHCINNNNINITIRDEFSQEIITIIDAMMKGVNPNNIMTKNTIREYLNKLTKNNYTSVLSQLEQIQYSDDIMTTLATELIIRSMNDYVSAKGFETENENTFTDINTDIIVVFAKKTADDEKKFGNIIRELCKTYFDDFINPSKSLDKNNLYRVDNFKGYMNFIGLLFRKKLISQKIVNLCLISLRDLFLNDIKTQEEAHNIFMAYERLVNQILTHYQSGATEEVKQFIEEIKKIHLQLTENNNKNRFKRFGLVTHEKILEKINKILAT